MRRLILWLLTMLLFLAVTPDAPAETLVSLDSHICAVDTIVDFSAPISALILGQDSILAGSGGGVYLNAGASSQWRKVISSAKRDPEDMWPDCYCKEKLESLFWPEHLWRLPGRDEILVFDSWCNLLLTLDIHDTGESVAGTWKIGEKCNWTWQVALQENLLICNGYEENGLQLALIRADRPRRPRWIFKIPSAVQTRLDTILIGSPSVLPALNPRDSTIWIDIHGYDSICVVDFDGDVVGMIPISGADWIPPPRPKSRIHSTAVYVDWVSRWTPTTGFQYASPGYFIRQHQIGWQSVLNDSIPLYSTLVWRADRRPVELSVDHRWQLAGVQPDGRVIFGHYDVADDSCRIVLNVTRIEP